MSNVMRLNDVLNKINFADTLYLNGIVFWEVPLWDLDKLTSENPIVHIDLVEEDYEDGPEDGRHNRYTVYVTIV